jgi:hypothetical protein
LHEKYTDNKDTVSQHNEISETFQSKKETN